MAMRACLVLLVLVAAGSVAVRADGPPRVPSDHVRLGPAVPAPPPSPPPANVLLLDGDLIIGGDYSFGGLGGCRHEAGWKFSDDSLVKGSLGRSPGACSVTCEWPVWETEWTRYSAVVGMESGFCGEWYLGHDCAARCEFLTLRRRLRAGVDWYPLFDRARLSFGIDLWRGGGYFNWGLAL
jgi:hypothetical protein